MPRYSTQPELVAGLDCPYFPMLFRDANGLLITEKTVMVDTDTGEIAYFVYNSAGETVIDLATGIPKVLFGKYAAPLLALSREEGLKHIETKSVGDITDKGLPVPDTEWEKEVKPEIEISGSRMHPIIDRFKELKYLVLNVGSNPTITMRITGYRIVDVYPDGSWNVEVQLWEK